MKREIALTGEVDIGEIVSESEDREDAYRRLSDELRSEQDRIERKFKRLLREGLDQGSIIPVKYSPSDRHRGLAGQNFKCDQR